MFVKKLFFSMMKVFVPTFFARIGFVFLSVVDTFVLAHYRSEDLAVQSLGDFPATLLILLVSALTQGVLFQTARAFGEQKYEKAGRAWHLALRNSLFMGIPLMVLCFFGRPLFLALGQEPALAEKAALVLMILGTGIPFACVFYVSLFFLQGINRPQVSMVMIWAANALNLGLNLALVFGFWIFPEMGALGTAISTTCVRIFLTVSLAGYILCMKDCRTFDTRSLRLPGKTDSRIQSRLGLAAAANIFSEECGMYFNVVMVTLIGLNAVALYSMLYKFMSVVFIIGVAVSVSGAFFVSTAFGEKDSKKVIQTMNGLLQINAMIMIPIGLLVWIFKMQIASFYTNDPVLQTALAEQLPLLGPVFLFQSSQAILIINFRALRDIFVPSVIKAVCFLVVMPAACVVFVRLWGLEISGVLYAVLAGNALASVLFFMRFVSFARRTVSNAARQE